MKEYPRIVYMGTPRLSSYILEGLINEGYNIIGVVTQEDRPVGRKGIMTPPPVKETALKYDIPVFQVKKIRDDYSFVEEKKPDLIITCAYGQLVPQGLLNIPPLGCINVHGSLLPKYRGASPIQQALINGDEESGVTIMEMIFQMDAGKMFHKKVVDVLVDDNYDSLSEKIKKIGLEALLEMLPEYIEKKSQKIDFGEEQDESLVTKCGKITKEQEHLSLDYTKEQFINWIRGLSEHPGGYVLLDNQVFKILKAKIHSSKVTGKVGEIVQADKNGLILQLKDGQIALLEVQKQGKNKMDYKSFVNGNRELVGKIVC
ncbi:MAG: methionyl-tRNA formyltransferase [Erysipelotrichaceae bacterium]|nr:methionyl-tRNA formyltransferase [Erysipelotrichaceae bacterium]